MPKINLYVPDDIFNRMSDFKSINWSELFQGAASARMARCEGEYILKDSQAVFVETEASIYEWQIATFGETPGYMRSATRANEEMAELLTICSLGETDKIGEEIADVILVLHGLAGRLGISIQDEINKKMAINRKRKWNVTDPGHGYHE